MQLTSYDNLTSGNIIFKERKDYKVKDPKPKYKRIQIETKYPNGKKRASMIGRLFFLVWCKRKEVPRNKQVTMSKTSASCLIRGFEVSRTPDETRSTRF